jgi:hypothetical protein
MWIETLNPTTIYSCIKYLPEREVSLVRGDVLMRAWETHPLVQKFSSLSTSACPPTYAPVHCNHETYILARATELKM